MWNRMCELNFFFSLCVYVSSVVPKLVLSTSLKYGGSKLTKWNKHHEWTKKNVNNAKRANEILMAWIILLFTREIKSLLIRPKLIKIRHTLHSSISYVCARLCIYIKTKNKFDVSKHWNPNPHQDWTFFSRFSTNYCNIHLNSLIVDFILSSVGWNGRPFCRCFVYLSGKCVYVCAMTISVKCIIISWVCAHLNGVGKIVYY